MKSCSPNLLHTNCFQFSQLFLRILIDLSMEQGKITHCNMKKMLHSYKDIISMRDKKTEYVIAEMMHSRFIFSCEECSCAPLLSHPYDSISPPISAFICCLTLWFKKCAANATLINRERGRHWSLEP